MKKKINKVFITIEGGCVTSVCDERSKELTDNIYIIDFDNESNGDCPVCGDELEYEDDHGYKCPQCGYVESDDNALECAVKLSNQKEK